jgi:hypothetical protein
VVLSLPTKAVVGALLSGPNAEVRCGFGRTMADPSRAEGGVERDPDRSAIWKTQKEIAL